MSFICPLPPAGARDLRCQAAARGTSRRTRENPAEKNAASPLFLRRCQQKGDLKCRTAETSHFVLLNARPLEREGGKKEEERGGKAPQRSEIKTSTAPWVRAPKERSDVIQQSQEGQGDHSGL